jgi:hypothetical protein
VFTLLPQYWAPGQTYNVTVTDTQGYLSPYSGSLPTSLYVIT